MKPQQRRLLGDVADVTAQGAELLRSVADMTSSCTNDLRQVRDALREDAAAGMTPAQIADIVAKLMKQFKTIASDFEGSADKFAEVAAQLAPYRRGGG